MKIVNKMFLATVLCMSAHASVIVSEDFTEGQGNWAVVAYANVSSLVSFQGGSVNIAGHSSGPSAVYLKFADVILQDGETLRLTANVTTTSTSENYTFRMGLGYAYSGFPAEGTYSSTLSVPMDGYYVSAPSGSSTANIASRYVFTDAGASPQVFFSPTTAGSVNFGTSVMTTDETLTSTIEPWVWEISRVGDDLMFSGSISGVAFGNTFTVPTTSLISDHTFNTLGFSSVNANRAIQVYDVQLALIPEPATIGMLGLGAIGLMLLRRSISHD